MRWELPRQALTWGYEKHIEWVVEGVACMTCAWVVAQGFWLLAPTSSTTPAKPSPTLAEQSRYVVTRHLFDVAHASSSFGEVGETPPPHDKGAHWRLIATYVDSGSRSRVVLTRDDGSGVVVAKVGESLPSGHEVLEVRPDRVLLSKDTQHSEIVLRPDAHSAQDQGPPEGHPNGAEMPPSIKGSQ